MGQRLNENESLKHMTIRQQVAKILRHKILIGELLPGDRIVESEIAAQLNISRGPVREAIRQLEEEGLVTYSTNKGCSVTTLDADDAWEIYILRAELETLAIRLCNGILSENTLNEMRSSINKMQAAADANDLMELIENEHNFHSCICKASNRKHLYKLWSSLNSTSFALFLTVTSAGIRKLQEIVPMHMEVLESLESGNQEFACQAIRSHYLSTGKELIFKKRKVR